MKTFTRAFCFLLMPLFLLLACNKVVEPVASFELSATEFEVNEAVVFTNTSTDADEYIWDFGDGQSSTDISPSHIYTETGNFTVKLTASSEGGINTFQKTIEITAPPLFGKWTIVEGTYNGNTIEGLSGYFNFVDDTRFKAGFDDGSDSGSVESKYTLEGTTINSSINGANLILNGMSSSYTFDPYEVIWSASMSCGRTAFGRWVKTAVGYDNPDISFSGSNLTITSPDKKTIITYEK